MKKNILIVGGTSGIGLELVKQMHQDHNLFVANRSKESLNGLSATHIPYDVEIDELIRCGRRDSLSLSSLPSLL